MNREEAIAIIRKEYLCVDRDCDIERSCGKCDLMMPSKEPILEAYKMAIKALEQEPKAEVLDKIRERVELEKLGYPPSAGYYRAIMKVLQIIDKYKAESEDKE